MPEQPPSLKPASSPRSVAPVSQSAFGKRTLIALGALGLVGVGLWFHVAGEDANRSPAGNPGLPGSLPSSEGTDGGSAAGRRPSGPSEPKMMSLAQREAILKEFNAKYPEYVRLYKLTIERRKNVRIEHPLIDLAWDYGHGRSIETDNRYRPVFEKHSEYLAAHTEEIKRFQEAENYLTPPIVFLQALASQEKVGDTTLGAIVNELITQTEYFDVLKERIAGAGTKYFQSSADFASVKSDFTPEQLIEAMRKLQPQLQARFERVSAETAPAPDLREALSALAYSEGIRDLMGMYKKSWTLDVDTLSGECTRRGIELQKLIEMLPMDSAERSAAAQQLSDYFSALSNIQYHTQQKPTP